MEKDYFHSQAHQIEIGVLNHNNQFDIVVYSIFVLLKLKNMILNNVRTIEVRVHPIPFFTVWGKIPLKEGVRKSTIADRIEFLLGF